MTARLRFFTGTMSSGKSTLALQTDYNYRAAGRIGIMLTRQDRAGHATVSSRLGAARPALEVSTTTDLIEEIISRVPEGGYVIADEVQFFTAEQIEQLAVVVDEHQVDIDCFGLVVDFTAHLFDGSKRLVELADELIAMHAPVLCWCGRPGRQNAWVVNGAVARSGEQVVIGDVTDTHVSYQVLCRQHWRTEQLSAD